MAVEENTHPARRDSIGGSTLADGAADKDTLGFEVYVEAIRAYLTHADTKGPLSLSIEGEWGSGKTSFMKMLRQQLQGEKTVWFNAWRHDREEELWAAFALTFVAELSRGLSWWVRFKAAMCLMYRRFDWRSGWFDFVRTIARTVLWVGVAAAIWIWGKEQLEEIQSLGGLAEKLWILLGLGVSFPAVRSFLQTTRDGLEIVGNPLRYDLRKHIQAENYAEHIGFVERFHRDFSRIVDVYAGEAPVWEP